VNLYRAAGEEEGEIERKDDEIALGKPPLVKILSPSNTSQFLSSNEETFIMFYAPGMFSIIQNLVFIVF